MAERDTEITRLELKNESCHPFSALVRQTDTALRRETANAKTTPVVKKNKNLAIPADAAAMPNPNTAATKAIIRKVAANLTLCHLLQARIASP
jgi:hypothetical protein